MIVVAHKASGAAGRGRAGVTQSASNHSRQQN